MGIVLILSLIGHSYVLSAQCSAGCSSIKAFTLNEVVICRKGVCGDKGSFSFSRSASLFPTVIFRIEGIDFYSDA